MSMNGIIKIFKKNKRFLISTHVSPDPDALCSELALAEYLRSIGKNVSIINDEKTPHRYQFLPGVKRIQVFRRNLKQEYDVAIIVDCGDLNRIGKVRDLLPKEKILVNIDHHITNDKFGQYNLVLPKASSTAEVLYELLSKAKCRFTKNLALLLYVGIVTDTGSFRYENTSARTHRIVAGLMKWNIAPQKLYHKLYETVAHKDIKEFTRVIGRFNMHFSGKVASVQLTKKVLSGFSEDFDLRDAIFRFLRSIKDVDAVVILTEVGRNRTRVNLRSSDKIDVAKVAEYFQGGGHQRASGCMVVKNISQARQAVMKKIRAQL